MATVEDIRGAWVAWYEPGDDRWTLDEFDAWLAAHDLEQKTKGFMLGWTAARVEPEHAAATHSRGFARMRASSDGGEA